MTIRIMLVDDQEMYRLGFRAVFDGREGFEIVGEADNGLTALDLLESVEPDVVLMDVRMPRMDGVEATRRVRERSSARVLVLTTFDLDEYAYDAIQAGASGFLLKDAPVDELIAAIQHVHDGDAVMAPSTTRRLLDRFTMTDRAFTQAEPAAVDEAALSGLSVREREVLGLLGRGLSNGEIAQRLTISEHTVRTHGQRIMNKLGLRDRVQAVVLAYKTGLVTADDL
ncbi:response regulator transcription factor [Brachybacterium alimentarium]|uniref:response regulator transcription factor n=1 Tax=Brachybacterium alimentarium TaxID=47845 RepID=UPI000DF26228|nr:response regulator transcription factor [Brachybacterium alimentarium]RCS76492.1 DNA-binding response regulator [Brachybacterium alimentarium]